MQCWPDAREAECVRVFVCCTPCVCMCVAHHACARVCVLRTMRVREFVCWYVCINVESYVEQVVSAIKHANTLLDQSFTS